MPDAQLERYKAVLARYRASTAARLVLAWDRLGSYAAEDVQRFETQTRPALVAAKQVAVATSAAFFALRLGIRPVGLTADDVDVEPRIRDPFLALWHAVAEGRPNSEALLAGRSTAEAVGVNFVTSAARRAGDHVAAASRRQVRWQRIPGAKACSWCVLVAGQTYHTAESADFGHDRCDCTAVPA